MIVTGPGPRCWGENEEEHNVDKEEHAIILISSSKLTVQAGFVLFFLFCLFVLFLSEQLKCRCNFLVKSGLTCTYYACWVSTRSMCEDSEFGGLRSRLMLGLNPKSTTYS